jgi:argininosuccinate lyase
MQLLKELLMPAFEEILDCLDITHFMLEHLQVKQNLLADAKYDLLFSVERVNELVVKGVPFRDAYRQVGKEINEGTYQASRELNHTHEGSIGNLCNEQITDLMNTEMERFNFEKVYAATLKLLN